MSDFTPIDKTSKIQKDLEQVDPLTLDLIHQKLILVGIVLSQIRMLEVVGDPMTSDNAAVQAAKVLTNTGLDPHILAERLKASALADKSPQELRELVLKLRSVATLEDLIQE